MKALIAGASGLVGSNLLELLLQDSRFGKIVAVGRRRLNISSPKLEELILDWNSDSAFELPPADVAFCCLGTTIKKAGSQDAFRKVDHDYVIRFARSSFRSGVKHFLVVSAIGSSERSKIFYSRVKGEMEQDLKKIGFETLHIFQPSLLLGERQEKRFGESLAIRLFPFYQPLLVGPLRKQMPIEARVVAKSMLEKSLSNAKGTIIVTNHEMLI